MPKRFLSKITIEYKDTEDVHTIISDNVKEFTVHESIANQICNI